MVGSISKSKIIAALTVIGLFFLLVFPVTNISLPRAEAQDHDVYMNGRSVMNSWFDYWGGNPVERNGYTLHYMELDGDLGNIFNTFADNVSGLSANTVVFFKFCFVDFYGDNLAQLQNIVEQVIETSQSVGLRLIIGNALPRINGETDAALVTEHNAYNSWLQGKASANSSVWIYDFYSILSDGSGNLRAEYSVDPGSDSHLNESAYAALDPSFFNLLDQIFGEAPSPEPEPGPPSPPTAVSTWYFAEGCTNHLFQEYIAIQNPNNQTATVQVTYMNQEGAFSQDPFYIAGNSRTTVDVNREFPLSDVSTKVVADQPIIAVRSMYWNENSAGHSSIGATSPANTWYMAEGCTREGFETWILVQNPGDTDTTAYLTFMTGEGDEVGTEVPLGAHARESVKVNDHVPDNWKVSTRVYSDQPIIAVRSMYWNERTAGHSSIGTTSPANTWHLAEGSTRGGYDTWICLQNPGDTDTTVYLTYMTDEGERGGTEVSLSAHARESVRIYDDVPDVWDISTMVYSDQPVIAERSLYLIDRIGGHCSIGYPQ